MKRTVSKAERPDAEKIVRWVERVAVFWSEQSGLPAITGRIVGWLMICDSPEQSAGEIATAIGASRASLTTSMRLLIAIGLVHAVSRAGQRTIYYRIDGDAWEMVVRRRIASMASFRAITREGLALLGDNKSRAARIQAADQVYAWAEDVFANAPPCPSTKPKTSS
jgi:DNA-binding transcriptional regulator GbsR (MarR family)